MMKTFEEIDKLNSLCNGVMNSESFMIFFIDESKKNVAGAVVGDIINVSSMMSQVLQNYPKLLPVFTTALLHSCLENNIDLIQLIKQIKIK